jgi:hypothetical protein
MRTITALTLTRPTDTRQLEPDATPDSWREQAACTEVPITGDFDPWFPEGHNPPYAAARAICYPCPVRLMCLKDALDEERGRGRPDRHGMRGGQTPGDRYKLDVASRGGGRVERPSPKRDRVIALTRAGKTTREIAEELGIEPRNVTLHRRKAREAGLLPEVAS